MRAVIHKIAADGITCSAKTDNDLALVFRCNDPRVRLGSVLHIELPTALSTGAATLSTESSTEDAELSITLKRDDVHDLREPAAHGKPSNVSDARMRAP